MNKKLMTVVSGLVFAVVLWFAIPSAMAQAKERHPKIRAAIVALEDAKKEMQGAAHDFGGHRVAALAECDKAIVQLREALKYDKD